MMPFKNLKYRLFIASFLIMLLAPNIVMLLGVEKSMTNNENTQFETPPKFNFKNIGLTLKNYKSYYLGNYGFKKTFVNQYLNFKSEILNENPLPNKVVIGHDNWYYLGDSYKQVLTNTFESQYKKSQILKVVKNIKTLSEYLKENNIEFYITVAPNKHSIYKEYLPYQLSNSNTFYNQIKKEFEVNNINYIDLQQTLLSHKEENKLYHKTDSHWNNLGAFYAYQEVIKTINKANIIDQVLLKDYTISSSIKPVNHLSKMININKREKVFDLNEKKPSKVDTISSKYDDLTYYNPNKKLKLLMSRDSFSDAWIPFFNTSFNQTKYIKNYNQISTKLIKDYKPDIVIYEIVERNLPYLTKPLLIKHP